MEDLETKVQKRINYMDLNILCSVVDKLEIYGVNFYNKKGEYHFDNFRKSCQKTSKLLFKNDKPLRQTGIRYQLCDFMSAVQTVVGIRNMSEFISE